MAYKYTTGSVKHGDIYAETTIDLDGNTYIDWNEDAMGVVAGGTTVFVVSGSTARAGIGTSAPGATLDILGDTSSDQLRLGLGGTNYYKIGRNSSTGFLDFQGNQAGYTGYTFKNDDGSTDLTILDSGYVGIGTASPSRALHVSGSNATAGIVIESDSAAIELYPANGPAIKFGIPNSNLDFQISGALGGVGYYFDQSEGNVGIGTTAPKTALDVHYTGSADPKNLSTNNGGGEVVYYGTGSNLQSGSVVYLNSDGGWEDASADATGSGHNQLLGVPLGTDPAAAGVLLRGYYNVHGDQYAGAFIKGGPVYIQSGSNGLMSGAAPTATDSYIRIVGYGTNTANVIYFNPDSTYVEIE